VLADKDVMLHIKPGQHGRFVFITLLFCWPELAYSGLTAIKLLLFSVCEISTFGGNPLASAVAMASLDVIVEEKLVERYSFAFYIDSGSLD